MAGVILHFEHPFRLGDRIKSGDFLGYIDSMNLRATVIRGRQGERITIPNKNILGSPITNYYITGVRRIDLYIGLDYTADLQQAEGLAVQAVESMASPLRDSQRPVEFFYEEIKDSTVILRIRFWTDPEQPVFLRARSEAIKLINQTFKDHGIIRPSQIVTLDFGLTGGVSLREQLEGLRLPQALPEGEQAGKGDDREA
jgi:small-conductance mechanosensitive channel